MKAFFTTLVICTLMMLSLATQAQQLHPTQVGLFGAGANSFFMSDVSGGGGQWASQATAQSSINYWSKTGNHLFYTVTGGNVGVGITPTLKLHVKDASASYVAQFEGSASTSIISVGSGSETGQSSLRVQSAGGQMWMSVDAATNLAQLTGTSGAVGYSFWLGGGERMRLHQSYRLAIGGGYTNPIALITNTSTAYDDNFGTVGNGQGFAFNAGTTSLNYAGGIRNEADNGTLGGNGFLVQADPEGRGAYVLSVTRSNAAKTRLFSVLGNGSTHVGNFTGQNRAFNVNGLSYFGSRILAGSTTDDGTNFIQVNQASSEGGLFIRSSAAGITSASIGLQSDAVAGIRGIGMVMYDASSQINWFAGRPYLGNDEFIIARATGVTTYNTQVAQTSNALFRVNTSGTSIQGNGIYYDASTLTGGSAASPTTAGIRFSGSQGAHRIAIIEGVSMTSNYGYGDLRFRVSSNIVTPTLEERMRITGATGNLLVNTTTDANSAYKIQVASGSIYSEGLSGVAYWTSPGQAISSTSGAISLRTPSITGGAVTIAPRTLNDALVVNTDGRTTIGTTTNNGVDRLQVNGSVRFSGVTKLDNSLQFTNATLGSITNGTATFSIYSKGVVSLPTTYGATPSGVADGELWTDLSASADHKLKFRQNGVNATVATREIDFAGGGTWAALSASTQQADANRNARVDANTNAITIEADLDMIEGLPYRRFIQRSTTNAVTVSVSGMSGNIYYTGCSTVGGCSTVTLSNNTCYELVRIGTTLWVKLL